jgi:hypothetical protein
MARIFHLATEGAVTRGGAVARRDLLAGGKSVEDELPSENLNLQRDFG